MTSLQPLPMPAMVAAGEIGAEVRFSENVPAHAARLRVAERWVSIRRQVLRRMLRGETIKRISDDISYRLAETTIPDVLRELGVRVADDDIHILVPDPDAGQIRRPDYRHYGLGGNPRLKLNPPFGYKTGRGGLWVADGRAAEAVQFAFMILAEQARRGGRLSWAAAATALNRAGFRRRDGGRWTSDDVRSLPRAVTYCGYGYLSKQQKLWRAMEIPNPLIDLNIYLTVARKAGPKIVWLAQLEQMARSRPR